MIKFLDGPAAGKVLALRRAPILLRAVQGPGGDWDALDQLNDEAGDGERIVAYRLEGEAGKVHVYFGGARGAWYASGNYRVVDPQPAHETMRLTESWRRWCRAIHAIPHSSPPPSAGCPPTPNNGTSAPA